MIELCSHTELRAAVQRAEQDAQLSLLSWANWAAWFKFAGTMWWTRHSACLVMQTELHNLTMPIRWSLCGGAMYGTGRSACLVERTRLQYLIILAHQILWGCLVQPTALHYLNMFCTTNSSTYWTWCPACLVELTGLHHLNSSSTLNFVSLLSWMNWTASFKFS